MTPIMSRVVSDHPNLGMWVNTFIALTQSAGGEGVDTFSFADPRKSSAENGSHFVNSTLFHVIVPMHENVRWLHIFNGSSGEEAAVVDMGPAIWNYCEENNWTDDYCRTADLNNNDIPDYQEDWGLEEAVDELNETAPEAEAPVVNLSEDALPAGPEEKPPEQPPGVAVPVGPKPGGADLTLAIVALIAVVAILLVVLALKKRKPKAAKTEGPRKPETRGQKGRFCAKCGAPVVPGDAFCKDCGTRL
jgi:hypothetical protein